MLVAVRLRLACSHVLSWLSLVFAVPSLLVLSGLSPQSSALWQCKVTSGGMLKTLELLSTDSHHSVGSALPSGFMASEQRWLEKLSGLGSWVLVLESSPSSASYQT